MDTDKFRRKPNRAFRRMSANWEGSCRFTRVIGFAMPKSFRPCFHFPFALSFLRGLYSMAVKCGGGENAVEEFG